MREAIRRALLLASLLATVATVHAENSLQGLEMDVMEPGESAAHATARIVLPRPAGLDGDYTGLDAEPRLRDAGESPGRDGFLGITGAPGDAAPVDNEVGRVADPGGDSGTTEGPVGQPGD
jgi:hypothetical protein